jgi:hypothetical protein
MSTGDPSSYDVRGVVGQFQVSGQFLDAAPYGTGHINDTFCVRVQQGGAVMRYILQRINHSVFKNPVGVMENIRRVSEHLQSKLPDPTEVNRHVLTLVPMREGPPWYVDAAGNHWRLYYFVEGTRCYDAIESTQQAYSAARSYGEFQKLLIDLPDPRLHDTIPNFHHTAKRFQALERAIAADVAGRAAQVQAEIEFALLREPMTRVLLEADVPERVTHNDTKLGNVLLDEVTGEGVCVIDLDTVMPGLVLYDFGDMVRTSTCPVREDERDLSLVTMQFPMFEALVRGYLSTAGDFLTPIEKKYLAFSGKLITFEIGIRFLTDFLSGDTYFKVHRDGHNLDRCRTQFRLVESIEAQEAAMDDLVRSIGG